MVDWKDLGKRTFDATKISQKRQLTHFKNGKMIQNELRKLKRKKLQRKQRKKLRKLKECKKKEIKKGKANRIMIIILLRKHSNPSLQRV